MAHPQQERQFRHHKQRPDNQPCHVIDERRFAPLVVMADKLNRPTHHKHTDAGGEPDACALLRQRMPGPDTQPQQHRHQRAKAQFQAQVKPRRKQ